MEYDILQVVGAWDLWMLEMNRIEFYCDYSKMNKAIKQSKIKPNKTESGQWISEIYFAI